MDNKENHPLELGNNTNTNMSSEPSPTEKQYSESQLHKNINETTETKFNT